MSASRSQVAITRANYLSLRCILVLFTSAMTVKSLTSAAWSTASYNLASKNTQKKRICAAKSARWKLTVPVNKTAKSMVNNRSIGSVCSAAQLLCTTVLAHITSAMIATMLGASLPTVKSQFVTVMEWTAHLEYHIHQRAVITPRAHSHLDVVFVGVIALLRWKKTTFLSKKSPWCL